MVKSSVFPWMSTTPIFMLLTSIINLMDDCWTLWKVICNSVGLGRGIPNDVTIS